MKVGSLFSGIGGLELGLEWAGMEVVWQVEWDDYATRVLEKHWPNVRRYRDVKDCGSHNLEKVDLICGGFPCQPVSCAGKRKGDRDERWLWPEFYRIIREVRPRWVLIENVRGLLSADAGRLFGGILGDLSQSGYDAEWDIVSAASVGAPHRRERVFVVAQRITEDEGDAPCPDPNGQRPYRTEADPPGQGGEVQPGNQQGRGFSTICEVMADPASIRGETRGPECEGQFGGSPSIFDGVCLREFRADTGAEQWRQDPADMADPLCDDPGVAHREGGNRGGADGEPHDRDGMGDDVGNCDSPRCEKDIAHPADVGGEREGVTEGECNPQSGVGRMVDGLSPWLDRYTPRVARGIPKRVDRLKCLGNAVVPQVSEFIGRLIMEATP